MKKIIIALSLLVLSSSSLAFEIYDTQVNVDGDPVNYGKEEHWTIKNDFLESKKNINSNSNLKSQKFVTAQINDTNGKVNIPVRVDGFHYIFIHNETNHVLTYGFEVNTITAHGNMHYTGHFRLNPGEDLKYDCDTYVYDQSQAKDYFTIESNTILVPDDPKDEAIDARKDAQMQITE